MVESLHSSSIVVYYTAVENTIAHYICWYVIATAASFCGSGGWCALSQKSLLRSSRRLIIPWSRAPTTLPAPGTARTQITVAALGKHRSTDIHRTRASAGSYVCGERLEARDLLQIVRAKNVAEKTHDVSPAVCSIYSSIRSLFLFRPQRRPLRRVIIDWAFFVVAQT